jgi:hypothetical protein
MRRAADIAAIAEASRDPETHRRLNDGPLSEEAQRGTVARTEQQWATGRLRRS